MLSLIVEQHAQEAAFPWETRRRAVNDGRRRRIRAVDRLTTLRR